MVLQKLDIYNVRNIKQISLTASAGINLIYGDNGSGKSSLLEAIFILGRAKSFRSHSINKIIQQGKQEIIVSGSSRHNDNLHTQIGVRVDNKQVEIRINGQNNRTRSDLAYALPLQVIHPKSYILLDGAAQIRREFIDWGAFNLYPNFLPAWKNFKKCLAQRNALLKQRQLAQLQVWNQEIVQYGTIVHDLRCQYMQRLEPVFREIANLFLEPGKIDLQMIAGWNTDRDFLELMEHNLARDLRYGHTQLGPHRDDFKLSINGYLARDYVSRGQLKLFVLALKIAQVKLLIQQKNISSCILIDDLTSELDAANKARLINYLADLGAQVFMTAIDKNDIADSGQLEDYRMFHVEHGAIIST